MACSAVTPINSQCTSVSLPVNDACSWYIVVNPLAQSSPVNTAGTSQTCEGLVQPSVFKYRIPKRDSHHQRPLLSGNGTLKCWICQGPHYAPQCDNNRSQGNCNKNINNNSRGEQNRNNKIHNNTDSINSIFALSRMNKINCISSLDQANSIDGQYYSIIKPHARQNY